MTWSPEWCQIEGEHTGRRARLVRWWWEKVFRAHVHVYRVGDVVEERGIVTTSWSNAECRCGRRIYYDP